MSQFKFNQAQEAILQTLASAKDGAAETKLRIKRLLMTDRRPGRQQKQDPAARRLAFHTRPPSGSGVEVLYSLYEVFALLVGLNLLAHGMPQATVVGAMRQLRGDLQAAHDEIMNKDAKLLFDQETVRRRARPGMLAVDNTAPVFVAMVNVRLRDKKAKVHASVAVCRGHERLAEFLKEYAPPGSFATISEWTTIAHKLAANLAHTRPSKRGPSSR